MIVSGDDQNEVHVHRITHSLPILTCTPVVQGQQTNYSTSVAFNCNGSTIASGSYRGTIYCWDTNTGKLIANMKGHNSSVRCISEIESEPQMLTSGSQDATIKIWG